MKTFTKMKYFLIFLGLLLISSNIFSQRLSNPESVTFDKANDRYLVSNADVINKNGQILSIDPYSQVISEFASENLTSPKGLIISNNTIYCTDITKIKGFNLESGKLSFSVKINDAIFLNDITTDGTNLYISDNIRNKVYSVNISSKKVITLIDNNELIKPNGLYFNSETNTILICSYRANSPIQSFDLNLNMLSLVTMTNISQMDGITMDQNGNYYVSSWNDNAIYKFDPLFIESPVQISNGYYGPADIFYDTYNDILAIPNFNSNIVNLMDMSSNEEDIKLNPYDIKIYPNPTSDLFTIYFKLENQTPISIQIMNKSGNIVYNTENNEYSAKEFQKIILDSKSIGLTKGVFFIKVIIAEDVFMKRIVILE